MKNLSFSLVIPCYNEAENLSSLIARCVQVCEAEPRIDVILVNNGSIDHTEQIFLAGFPHPRISSISISKNKGYGFGILSGLKVAQGDVLGWTHADMQTDPMDVINAVKKFDDVNNSQSIFVKGWRVGRPWRDLIFTWAMSLFATLVLRIKLCDINAQPTFFHRDFYHNWQKPPLDFALDAYVYAQAVKHGHEVHRCRVNFGFRVAGEGHNEGLPAKLRYSYRSVRDIFSLRNILR